MLKLIPLLFALSPIASAVAQETDTSDLSDELNTVNKTELKVVSQSMEEKSAPRDVNFYFRQCYQNVPPITERNNNLDKSQIPINIDADSLRGLNGEIIYEGDVNAVQGEKSLDADKMVYNRNTSQANATGNARYVDGQVTLIANEINTNFKTDESSLIQTEFQFHGRGGRGSADRIYDNGQGQYELKSSSYTACPPNDITWSLDASTLHIDQEADMGTAYNAVLRIKDVPVFYFPYISYPLSDKRKTGILFPTYEFSSVNGFTYNQPLYINIAPNQDATITPTYMQNRGLLVSTEYRYLFDVGSGTLQFEYLNDDRIRKDDNGDDIGERYLVHFDHDVTFAEDWNFNVDYNKVSDEYYFNDITTEYGSRSDNQLLQNANLSYTKTNWNAELEVRNFQVLNNDEYNTDDDTPHIVLPKLAFSAYQPLNWKSLQFDWYSEITRFEHSDDDIYTGTRIHVEPKLSLPLYYDSLFVNTELKYMLSYYQQDLDNATKYDWYDDLEESTVRYLPSFKINSGVNLERDFSWFGDDYRQTLVPQIQYLYVPYQDQSGIGLYDTTTLQQDYYGLFRDNRFSGYDRIAEADQITLGVSTSFLNDQGRERLRFAIGQNYYFSESRTVLPTDDDDDDDKEVNRSSIVSEIDVNFDNDYFFHGGIEWDSDDNFIQRANTTFEKRWAYNTYAQLSYRYYKEDKDAEWDEIVNQVGTKVNWSIDTQWSTFASYYYNVEFQNSFESIIGLKYQSCCWAIGLTYDRHMLSYFGDEASYDEDVETESSVSITFELMGLGGVGNSGYEDGLFDYGRPFYLK
ncbi:LPS assembly protein LptD [Psychromonas sp. L1A2]|uniref:LPS assembly protein LptD n=1 Tax=Psychromonas sp. L1A2 TaxID=2686356 RepID=UPI001358780F|nr:LPS assembly protein LptD [Psychromonas sp. L1A2]